MAKVTKNPGETQDEPMFRYSLELVSMVAAHFAGRNMTDSDAADRAIKLIDTVKATIDRRIVVLQARRKAEQLSRETPRHLDFAKGIRRITKKRTETDATKAFREHLRLNLRLNALGRPESLTDEQKQKLLRPLAKQKERHGEDTTIESLIAKYRQKGFSQVDLISISKERDYLQRTLVQPYQNSQKGRMPSASGKRRGRPNKPKKDLVAKVPTEK